MDLFLISIFALVHLSIFASVLFFDSLILGMQSFNPSWPLKNRLWAYPGGKEPSLFVLGLLFCVGISFPLSDSMCTPLICFKHVCHMASGQPHYCVCSLQGGDRDLDSAAPRGVCVDQWPCVGF